MNIYLDIDGVLLANSVQAANFADDFLEYIISRWPNSTYWLTTHCWRGENRVIEILSPVLKTRTTRLLSHVKPTEWGSLKTDAIDYSQPFLWFDDDLFPDERSELQILDAVPNWREVNLSRDPNQLLDEIDFLKSLAD